jgi:hypothetical protein
VSNALPNGRSSESERSRLVVVDVVVEKLWTRNGKRNDAQEMMS